MTVESVGGLVAETGMAIVGERHGTNEFPNLFFKIATQAARRGRLVVALEMGGDAKDPTSNFIRSLGGSVDRAELLATKSWQAQDGRASHAMFALVDGLRRLVNAGASIDVDTFDVTPEGDPQSDQHQLERERLLADRLLDISAQATTLALTGNVHAELTPRVGAPDGFVTAAAHVAANTNVISLAGRHAGGQSWCTLPINGQLVSGVHAVDGKDRGPSEFVDIDRPSAVRTGFAYVSKITPSPPIVTQT